MKNIIVLTSGLSGSSVVTNLISKAGYWKGDSTCEKDDYNTHENSRLVYLNEQLLKRLEYDKEYSRVVRLKEYSRVVRLDVLPAVERLFNELDLSPFKEFILECEQAGPWIWKDPRLWVTMPFWIQLLDRDSFQVVVVDRSISQRWISEILRRNIQTFKYCANYNSKIKQLIKQVIEKHHLSSCDVLFDDLIERPEHVLALINSFLGSSLRIEDLKLVYDKPLYRKARGMKSLFLAMLIYLKNYHLRLK